MDSGIACGRGPAVTSSIPGAARGASASPREPVSLRRPDDFRRVLSSGRRVRRGGVTVISAPSPDGEIRVGLVVGRSAGNAVTRNRIKRRLRHALARLPMEQGMEHVIIADRRVAEVPFEDLCASLAPGLESRS